MHRDIHCSKVGYLWRRRISSVRGSDRRRLYLAHGCLTNVVELVVRMSTSRSQPEGWLHAWLGQPNSSWPYNHGSSHFACIASLDLPICTGSDLSRLLERQTDPSLIGLARWWARTLLETLFLIRKRCRVMSSTATESHMLRPTATCPGRAGTSFHSDKKLAPTSDHIDDVKR